MERILAFILALFETFGIVVFGFDDVSDWVRLILATLSVTCLGILVLDRYHPEWFSPNVCTESKFAEILAKLQQEGADGEKIAKVLAQRCGRSTLVEMALPEGSTTSKKLSVGVEATSFFFTNSFIWMFCVLVGAVLLLAAWNYSANSNFVRRLRPLHGVWLGLVFISWHAVGFLERIRSGSISPFVVFMSVVPIVTLSAGEDFRPTWWGGVMDQFLSGILQLCPFASNVGLSRWVVGVGLFFTYFLLAMVFSVRNLNQVIAGAWQRAITLLAEFFFNLVRGNIDLFYYFINLIAILFFVFLVIILFNLLSLIPYTFAYTSHIILTFTLSSFLISLANFLGLERHGLFFIKIFFPGGAPLFLSPFLIFIEFVSYNTRVLSLAIRLFANIMSGHILLTIFAGFSVALGFLKSLPIRILMLAIYVLEHLIGFLQGYVFLTLSTIYFLGNIHLH